MEDLYSFLEQTSNRSGFKANLSERGGFVTFSNSGRRGGAKCFHIGLDSLLRTLKDILEHIDVFRDITDYVEKSWRDNGSSYFTDPVANANSTVQTKPLFSTLSKIIMWANQPDMNNINPDEHMVITEEALNTTIEKLENVAETFRPRHKNILKEEPNDSLQKIFYGAPGTGKSHKISDDGNVKIAATRDLVFRTTFHPDTDYATFVGCYKPKTHKKSMIDGNGINETQLLSCFFDSNSSKYKGENKARYLYEALVHTKDIKDLGLDAQAIADKLKTKGFSSCAYTTEATCMFNIYKWLKEDGYIVENKLSYEFTPQCFVKAYIEAWKHQQSGEPVFLIIEEINRGNCAQIFGDLFQLLDRDNNGFSCYEISPDSDLQEYIAGIGLDITNITDTDGNDISAKIANGELMKLPNNLYIWATMNTSDQSLFPIDSAFKRRWEWKYIKITKPKDKNWELEDGTKWWDFLQMINAIIASMTSSADKQLGYFFCKPDKDNNTISYERFVNKVVFYLWNDVFKDYAMDEGQLFKFTPQDEEKKDLEERDLTYPDFYDDITGKEQNYVVKQFIDHVMNWKKEEKKV